MKITKNLIENLIKEELSKIVNEQIDTSPAQVDPSDYAVTAFFPKLQQGISKKSSHPLVKMWTGAFSKEYASSKDTDKAAAAANQLVKAAMLKRRAEKAAAAKTPQAKAKPTPGVTNTATGNRAMRAVNAIGKGAEAVKAQMTKDGYSPEEATKVATLVQQGKGDEAIAALQGPRESKITKARIESYIMEELANITKEQTALHKKLATQRDIQAGSIWSSSDAKQVLDAKLAAGEIDAGAYDIAKQMFMDTIVKLNNDPRGSLIDMGAEASAAAMNALDDMGGDVPRQMVAPLPRPR